MRVREQTDITLGVTGLRPRWSVSPWGSITPWGGADVNAFNWYVAADDRWHVPADEPTVRQQRVEGAPVVETRVRVPDGDAVQRAWAVPDHDGMVIVEFENESPKPFAIAVSGGVVTERPPADVPIQGIELPDDAIVLPVGHRATMQIALPAAGNVAPRSLPTVPPHLAVVRGWTRVVEQASRLVLPDESLVTEFVAARCDLLLEGPVDADEDPAGFLLDVAELVRCGDDASAWMLDIVEPLARVASAVSGRSGIVDRLLRRASGDEPELSQRDAREALAAGRLVTAAAGDTRATGDVDRILADLGPDQDAAAAPLSFADLRRGASVGRFVRSVEQRLANGGELIPGGMPSTWLGNNFEVHALPTSAASSVSFAVRWHGERPAVLWEQHGERLVPLSAPSIDAGWSSSERSGEALWEAPQAARTRSTPLTLNVEGGSFS